MHGNRVRKQRKQNQQEEVERGEVEELEWLMLQLRNRGGNSLEDVLEKIERGRQKDEGCKPSLESIMECPEVVEMDR
ncbi:hypothetical protein FEM48_Zijuj11G0013700 [Ziziphus jujuba var. spinosa]|uniref:Uncharacterized protein n=1 Tax=Ziziphus jujuba var. spinosa TaxID=714518 RepID=A0A978UG11_ZIZJJ|nr:hypothetical protein FEM48_Zijuj11G0013700 [Ziziphus jujuba var. spinosa]